MEQSRDLIKKQDFPKPPARTRSNRSELNKESKRIGLEMAALAWVQMEQGAYRYAKGVPRQYNEDGSPRPSKAECMRLAGYSPKSFNNFDRDLGSQEEFWQLVELFRIRTTDPHFRKDQEDQLWTDVGGEAMRNLYERVTYYPHQMPTADLIKIVQLMLQGGLTLQKLGGSDPAAAKKEALLQQLKPEQREKVVTDYKKKLQKELDDIEALEKAHLAADAEEADYEPID